MMLAMHAILPHGIILSDSVLHSYWFAVLAAFVALNTVMYAALAVARTLPKIYRSDWFSRPNQRTKTRSIYPDAPVLPEQASTDR